jgi:hypothetical protein
MILSEAEGPALLCCIYGGTGSAFSISQPILL